MPATTPRTPMTANGPRPAAVLRDAIALGEVSDAGDEGPRGEDVGEGQEGDARDEDRDHPEDDPQHTLEQEHPPVAGGDGEHDRPSTCGSPETHPAAAAIASRSYAVGPALPGSSSGMVPCR